MKIKLPHWLPPEIGQPMLTKNALSRMAGQPEFIATVKASNGQRFERRVAKVTLMHPSKGDREAIADTTTGSLYVAGKCMSGPLRMLGKLSESGRMVPKNEVRQREGLARSVAMEFGGEEE